MKKAKGSVVFNKLRSTWNYLWRENGKPKSRKLGSLAELPTEEDAWEKAAAVRRDVRLGAKRGIPTVRALAEQYQKERMPKRFSTRHGYDAWTENHVLPRWGDLPITDVQAREAETWILSLKKLEAPTEPLAPASMVHVRGTLHRLWEFAMWAKHVPIQRNPMELVQIPGGCKRTREPRSLTVKEFQTFLAKLREPFRTIALVCVCLGLRISECLALKWADLDWLESRLSIERGIVRQHVDETKNSGSKKPLVVSAELLKVFKAWKQTTEFSGPEDWIFASPTQLGKLPWSYPYVWRVFKKTALAAGLGRLGTHTMRHTYRMWLDATGTTVGVQQKLMRHADIRTTMNIYGDAATKDMKRAHSKVVRMALPRQQ